MREGSAALPPGWLELDFAELFVSPSDDIVDGPFGSNLKATEYVSAGIPVVRLQNVDRNRFVPKNIQFVTEAKANQLSRHTFGPGDVLITKLGDPLGKACPAPPTIDRGVLVADVVRARLTHQWVDRAFLCYQINSENIARQFSHQTKGTTRPRVNLTKIRALKTRLCPLSEQARIVAKLEELMSDLDAGVAELEAAKAKLAQYRRSLLKAAVEGALTADWRREHAGEGETGEALLQRILVERRARWEARQRAKFEQQGKVPPKGWQGAYPEPVLPDASKLATLPQGWCWATPELVGSVLLGRQRAPQYLTGRWSRRYLRVANIKDDRIDFSDVESMDFNEVHFEKYRLLEGDILVSEGQSPELVGQSAIFRGHPEPLCFQKTLHRFRAEPGVTLADYAQLVFRSNVYAGVFRAIASITTNIAHLTLEKFEISPFPLPPLSEQHRIVAAMGALLAQVKTMEQGIETSSKQSTAQRQNLLRAAFSGRLVPQDPNDEPASVLLERIRAARATEADKKVATPRRQTPVRRRRAGAAT